MILLEVIRNGERKSTSKDNKVQKSLQSEQMWRARNRNTGGGFDNAQQSNEVLRGFIYIINTNIRFK